MEAFRYAVGAREAPHAADLDLPAGKRAAKLAAVLDPPPSKWSALKYGNVPEEDHDAEEETQAGRDRRQVAAG